MTRERTRPAHDLATLAALYGVPYRSAERGPDHIERVRVTAGLAAGIMARHGLATLADLSCGDGEMARAVRLLLHPGIGLTLGDYAAHPDLDLVGPMEETISQLDPVDLFLCSETLEHLDDPDLVLRQIRASAKWLVCSTPLAAWGDPNPEHYWAWDEADLHDMLIAAGWKPRTYATLQPEPGYYTFQLWACS